MPPRFGALLIVVATVGIAACSALEGAGVPGIGPRNAVSDEAFTLAISSPRSTWSTAEPIQIETELTYTGAAETVDVYGSGTGIVAFSIDQRDGPFDLAGASTSDCVAKTMTRGKVERIPFSKSGGWNGDDPMTARFQAFFADPELHLSPGTYSITASLDGFLGECAIGADHTLAAAITISVTG